MVKKPNYCKGIIMVHGRSEYLLVEHIKSNLHLPIEIYAAKNGKMSIQIDGLKTILGNSIFKNKKALKAEYILEEKNGVFPNFFVMPVMDLDDTSDEKKKLYRTGELFQNHWLSPYIMPIWNEPNLDTVLYEQKVIQKIPNAKEKGKMYREILPPHTGETDIKRVEELRKIFAKSNKTNMEIMLQRCLDTVQEIKKEKR